MAPAASLGARFRMVAAALVFGLLALYALGLFLLPTSSATIHAWTDLGWTFFSGLATLVSIRVAMGMELPGRRAAWWCFALGSGAWTLGILQWTWLELVDHVVTPFPTIGDIGYLTTPVSFAIGLFFYGSDAGGVSATRKQLGEIGAVLATMGTMYGFIFGEAIEHQGTSLIYRATALAYPVLHSTALCFALTVLWSRSWQRQSLRVVAYIFSGLLSLTIVNTYYAQTILLATYEAGHFLDPGWALCFAFTVMAGVAELSRDRVAVHDERIRATMGDIIIPSFCIASIAISGYFQGFHADSSAPFIAAMGVLLALSLAVRNFAQREIEAALRDEVRDRERQFVEAQRMEAVATLAGGLAHDFNNSLTGILGGVTMLRQGIARGKPDASFLELIEQSAERAAELTKRLLVFARRRESQIAPARPSDILRRAAMLVRSAAPENVVVRELEAPRDLVLNVDASQLEHALVNLGLNAVHAMPSGGRLDFALVVDRAADRAAGGDSLDDAVIFEVTDTGVGIPTEAREKIFEPFYSTRAPGEGTGLGLAMVKATATAHGGSVDFTSVIGEGTTFRIRIPLIEARAADTLASEVDMHASGHESVLVVDDRGAALLATQAILESSGYRVHATSRSADALRIVDEEPELSLLLVDLVLGDTTGLELAIRIREKRPNLPVVLMTGHLRPTDLPAFVVDVLEKPYRSKDLTSCVRRAIEASRADVRATG